MVRYAVIRKENMPDLLPMASVKWEFTILDVVYLGLEWGDNEEPQDLGAGWDVFSNTNEFHEWFDSKA